MRIIAGRFRSRAIKAPAGDKTRPTSDRVREALFSMLQARLDIDNVSVLDLYAGSGALGLEALSRGAKHVTLVERDNKVISILRDNITALGVADQATVIVGDSEKFLSASEASFQLILADPPYASPTVRLLPLPMRRLLSPGGIAVIEHGAGVNFDSEGGVILTRQFGQTHITLFEAVS